LQRQPLGIQLGSFGPVAYFAVSHSTPSTRISLASVCHFGSLRSHS
jgi:hypothetical protein